MVDVSHKLKQIQISMTSYICAFTAAVMLVALCWYHLKMSIIQTTHDQNNYFQKKVMKLFKLW